LARRTPEGIERDFPEWAADLARHHDRGRAPGAWREPVRQVFDTGRPNPYYTVADLGRIATPTLLVAGEDDPYAHIDQMVTRKRAIPGIEWLIVNDAGRVLQHYQAATVGPRVLDFLDRHSDPAPAA
jgi:pimeloyl-ACP methyl ester carboxylesterase